MKKTISVIAAAAMMCAAVSPVFAANKESGNPDVFVNGTKIFFDDQEAVIEDGRTLVPARGVFEAMGAKVSWDEEKQQVQVESADDNTWVRLIIDDADMKVYDMSGMFGTLLMGQSFEAPETVVALEVPPQIMNERTMVPLRAISESIGADVQWNEDEYRVDITTAENPTDEELSTMPKYTLSTSADTVNEGDTVDLYIDVTNLPENTYVSSVTAGIHYDKTAFEYVDATLVNGDTEISPAFAAANPDFADGCLKVLYGTIDETTAAKEDGRVMKITFKSINGKEGEFSLSNTYHTDPLFNNDTMLAVYSMSENIDKEISGEDFYIDTTPVTVNAGK